MDAEWLDYPDLLDKAQEFIDLGLYEDARALLTRYEPFHRDDWEIFYLFGRLYSDQNQPLKALPYLYKGLKVDPDNLDCLLGLFFAYAQLDQLKKGAKYLATAEKLHPENEHVLSALIWYYIEINRFDSAISTFEKFKDHPTSNPEVYRNAGIAFERSGQLDKAERCFIHALEMNPSFEEARDLLADHYIFKGETDKSISLYQDFLRKSPNSIRSMSRLVFCFSQNNQTEEAITAANEIIKQYPNSPVGYVDLAYVYLNNDDPQTAFTIAEKGLDVTPLDAEAYRVKALALSDMGKDDEAEQAFASALGLDPQNPEIQRDYYHHLRNIEKFDEMEKVVNDVIRHEDPYCMEDYWFLADYYKEKNQELKAFSYLHKAYSTMPGEKELLPAMSEILLDRGHTAIGANFLWNYVQHSGWNPTMDMLVRHKRLKGRASQEALRFLRFYGQKGTEYRTFVFAWYLQKYLTIILIAMFGPLMFLLWVLFGTLGIGITICAYIVIAGVIVFVKYLAIRRLKNTELEPL